MTPLKCPHPTPRQEALGKSALGLDGCRWADHPPFTQFLGGTLQSREPLQRCLSPG